MRSRTTYTAFLSFLAAAFVLLQTLSVFHTVKYGDDTHEHNGVVCTLVSIAHTDVGILPSTLKVTLPVAVQRTDYKTDYVSVLISDVLLRWPPPRGSPFVS